MAATALKVLSFPPLENDPLPEDRWETDSDSHLIVRETEPWKMRERWAKIRLRVHEMKLQEELETAHVAEQYDETVAAALPKETSKLADTLDFIATIICRFAHHLPTYQPGSQVSICPSCGRKYAVPWAIRSKVEEGVYFPNEKFIAPTELTKQALCRNGQAGMC